MTLAYKDQILTNEKIFRDPIHNDIQVQHQVILDLINSKEFQRLRRIKQLGTTSFTFHGAEHSRFAHSLGVYEISRQICDIFERKYSIQIDPNNGWDDKERLVTLCAALLHDVGHGPYSHTFEGIFNTNHEAITIEIITSPETEVFKILSNVSPDFPDKVASVIRKDYPNPQVVQMISSQIDADRMDYLLRDAYYTGTRYGTFDLARILQVIRPHKNGIVFEASGMHAVEDYIVSRYQMYMQIYFHPVSRGMEVVLNRLLHRGADLYKMDPTYYDNQMTLLIPFFNETYTLSDYLRLDDGVLNTYFTLWLDDCDAILSDLAKRFLYRKPLKSVKIQELTNEDVCLKLTALIEKVGFNPDYYTAQNTSSDLPYDFYRPDQDHPRTQIELIKQDGSLTELSKSSALVAALTGQINRDARFFFPKEMKYHEEATNLFQVDLEEFTTLLQQHKLI